MAHKIIGKLKDIIFTRDRKQIISFTTSEDFTEMFDALKDFDVDIEVKKHRPKRSNDANAYCWVLCQKIAEKLSDDGVIRTKDEIYRTEIRAIGVFKDFCNLRPEDAETLKTAWEMLGTGWITEQVDYSQDGEKVTLRCYYGSSRYNSKQMSRLIDALVEDCRDLGIPTETPEEIENIKSLWATAPKGDKK